MERLKEVLKGNGGSYIFPFLWMKGEKEAVIREEIGKIAECGIREICLESRPHPDFCGPGWWKSLDIIVEEAKKRGMRLWILDDRKFPTGYANGGFEKHPELAKVYLAERHVDLVGPKRKAAVLISPFLSPDGEVVSVLALRRASGSTTELCMDSVIDLTDQVENGFVYLDIPKGRWRLLVIYTTRTGSGRANYMNLIDSRSVRVLIDEVYEKHYEHYKEEFGKTIAGFFSDEPELGNVGGYDFHETLGRPERRLPWSLELLEKLKETWGEALCRNLPALWFGAGEDTVRIRSQYMEGITDLVYHCFTGQIKGWCEEHQVDYIGHIIEDDNAHTRMGCSIGHYFKEMRGRHMGGVDVVHFQIVPGFEDPVHQWLGWDTDGEFFHYGLAKLGSSCAHIDAHKKGRSMCEIFGNYGWALGVGKMRWLTNHMLVRGINHFTPHAFSMIFPDRDCPPHFYARGNNPQFPFFAELMQYMNRMCHLINGGIHLSNAAILYHGEAEWGGGERMAFHIPGRCLMESQMDYDVVPEDIFDRENADIQDKRLVVNGETYGCLIQPWFENIPEGFMNGAVRAAKEGLPIFVVDDLPKRTTLGNPVSKEYLDAVRVVKLKDLAEAVRELGCFLRVEGTFPHLRTYLYQDQEAVYAQFFNESVEESCETMVHFGEETVMVAEYDGFENTLKMFRTEGGTCCLRLEPGEAKVWIPCTKSMAEELKAFVSKEETGAIKKQPELISVSEVSADWRVSFKEALEKEFTGCYTIPKEAELPNMNSAGLYPEFSGTYRYEGGFEAAGVSGAEKVMLYFPAVGDCAVLYVNGVRAGSLIGSPIRMDVTGLLRDGWNELVIEVTNTLVWKIKDPVSTQMQLDPTGMTERPVLELYGRRK